MERSCWLFGALFVLALACGGASARRCPLLHASDTANKTGCYIISLYKDTSPERLLEILQLATSLAEENKVYGFVQTVIKAFTLKLNAYSLEVVSCVVINFEKNSVVS